MNRKDKCEEILKKIVEIVNKNKEGDKSNRITFAPDIFNNRLCVLYDIFGDHGHYHVNGDIDSEFTRLVDDLYSFLNKMIEETKNV